MMDFYEKIDYAAYESELITLASENKSISLKTIGKTYEGRCLYSLELQGSGPDIMITSGHHGNEPAGPMAVLNFIEDWSENPLDYNVTVFPLINPDGYEMNRRENSRLEDLNRQYENTTEVEIQSLINALDTERNYVAALDLHEAPMYDEGFFVYESIPVENDILLGQAIVDKIGQQYPLYNDGVNRSISREGSCRHFFHTMGAYSITFETPGQWDIDKRIDMEMIGLYAALDKLSQIKM